jgi:hypothetical protein
MTGKTLSKVKAKRETRPHDADVFRIAAAMLNLTPSKDNKMFGVTRQTLTAWMRGETSAPRAAYVLLLDELLKAIEAGTINAPAAEQAKYERITAALEMAKQNKNGGTK